MRNIITLTYILALQLSLSAQDWKTGIINDPDGYTNIRSGKGSNFEIVDKILTNELFSYVDSSNENWLMVKITKCNCDEPHRLYNEITGFVHRSRIQGLNELEQLARKKIFSEIFSTELDLYKQIMNSSEKETKEYKRINGKRKVFHDYQFDASLVSFVKYLCEFKDTELMNEYLNLLEEEKGFADESPMFALGRIFICQPDWTFEQMTKHIGLMKHFEWGFMNVIYSKTESESNLYKIKYNQLRKSYGMSEADFSIYEE